jgi:ribosomal protein L37E
MGMYDSVMVPCPRCGERSEFQSKSGDCTLATYSINDAPADVLQGVNRHSPNVCKKCGVAFCVEIVVIARPVIWMGKDE